MTRISLDVAMDMMSVAATFLRRTFPLGSIKRGIAVHGGGQVDILLRHPAGIMGRQGDIDLVVDIEPFGMVIHLRRQQRAARHEGEGGVEIHKLEFAGDGLAVLGQLPVRQPLQRRVCNSSIANFPSMIAMNLSRDMSCSMR